jgi:Tol biopolymer transport system component
VIALGLFSLIVFLAIAAVAESWENKLAIVPLRVQINAGGALLYTRGGIVNRDIGVVNMDGTGDRALTTDNHSHSAGWSPDGRRILYIHDNALLMPPAYRDADDKTHHPVDLQVMDRDGSNVRLLRRFGYIDSAAWSPDGRMLAITCALSEQDKTVGLFLLPANGQGDPRLLTPDAHRPTWSPDGKTIIFSSHKDGHWALYAIGVDGSGEKRLATGPLEAVYSAWSPDGKRIAFDAFKVPGQVQQVYIMGTDASNLHQVTHEAGDCENPSWSPDGRQLAFSCETTPDACRRYFFPSAVVIGDSQTETDACKWRIFVILPDDSSSALAPLIQHDAVLPAFAPK